MPKRATRLVIAAAAAAALVVAIVLLPLGRWALALVDLVRGVGWIGALLYGAVYAVATVLLVPGSLLTLGAGFLYGVGGGAALVVPAATLGATGAFFVGRFLARDRARRLIAGYPRLDAVDRAISGGSLGIVVLMRLSPLVPFVVINYFFSVTRVRAGVYVLGTAVGMVPGVFLYVYLGSLITNAAALASGDRPDSGVWGQVVFWGGLVATAAVTIWISRRARAELAKRAGEAADED